MEFESQGSRNLWAVAAECQRGPAPSETFIYSIAAGWHFIDFHDFLVSWDFMRFHGFRASGVEKPVGAFAAECQRGPAPLETFILDPR